MKRFILMLVCVSMAMIMVACAPMPKVQQYEQRPPTEQEILAMVPYPFSIKVGNGHYVVNGKSSTPQESWLNFAAAMKPQPKEFAVWMSPKLVDVLNYNNNVRDLFEKMGYSCVKQELVDVAYVPQEERKKRRPKTTNMKIYQMQFVWAGGTIQTKQQMGTQGTSQYQFDTTQRLEYEVSDFARQTESQSQYRVNPVMQQQLWGK